MNILRNGIDLSYHAIKPVVFKLTEKDPELAHKLFVTYLRGVHKSRLGNILFNHSDNLLQPPYEIANGAGMNKNGDIPPQMLKALGFDRVVVGTVNYESWPGNDERPRCVRFPLTESMVNWLGFPGVGALQVADNLYSFGDHGVPITVNVMSRPQKEGDEMIRDIENTVKHMSSIPYVDEFELNPSCVNTHGDKDPKEALKAYQLVYEDMLRVVCDNVKPHQIVRIKMSPDINEQEVEFYCEISSQFPQVKGFVTCNTSGNHDSKYITRKLPRGGASGNASYHPSLRVQRLFEQEFEKRGLDWELRAGGGISSLERALERTQSQYATGIRIYTPLIFKGTSLPRKLRRYEI